MPSTLGGSGVVTHSPRSARRKSSRLAGWVPTPRSRMTWSTSRVRRSCAQRGRQADAVALRFEQKSGHGRLDGTQLIERGVLRGADALFRRDAEHRVEPLTFFAGTFGAREQKSTSGSTAGTSK